MKETWRWVPVEPVKDGETVRIIDPDGNFYYVSPRYLGVFEGHFEIYQDGKLIALKYC